MCLLAFKAVWSQRQAPTDPDIWAFKALNPRDLFPPARQNTAPPTNSAACACKCARECLYANISLPYCCFAMQQSEKKMETKVRVAYSGLHTCFCLRLWETVLSSCCFVCRFDFVKHSDRQWWHAQIWNFKYFSMSQATCSVYCLIKHDTIEGGVAVYHTKHTWSTYVKNSI